MPQAGDTAAPRALRAQIHSSATMPVDTHTFSSPEPYQTHVEGVTSSIVANKTALAVAARSPVTDRSSDHTSITIAPNISVSMRMCVVIGSKTPISRKTVTAKNSSGLLKPSTGHPSHDGARE